MRVCVWLFKGDQINTHSVNLDGCVCVFLRLSGSIQFQTLISNFLQRSGCREVAAPTCRFLWADKTSLIRSESAALTELLSSRWRRVALIRKPSQRDTSQSSRRGRSYLNLLNVILHFKMSGGCIHNDKLEHRDGNTDWSGRSALD